MIQIVFGWPGMILTIILASVAIGLRVPWLLLLATVLSVPSSFYFYGGNGWVQMMGIYIPFSLGISVYLVNKKYQLLPVLLLVPVCLFYIYLGIAVATQVSGGGQAIQLQ